MTTLPRAVATTIGAGLHAFIEAAAQAVEAKVQAEVVSEPTPILPAAPRHPRLRNPVDDATYVLKRVAVERLRRRGFQVRNPGVDIFRTVVGDGVCVRARHECGSLVFVCIDAIDLFMAGSAASFVDLIIDALDRAGCYCVPREVIVPCTAQRCEAAQ